MKKVLALIVLIIITITSCVNSTKNDWTIKYFKDKYGDILEDSKYISTTKPIEGTFSNSVANNSKCNFDFIISGDDLCGLIISEYGVYHDSIYKTEYDCEMRFDDGTTSADFTAETKRYTDADKSIIVFENNWIKDVLLEKKNFKLYLKEDTKYGTPSSYLVSVEASNFETVYLDYKK